MAKFVAECFLVAVYLLGFVTSTENCTRGSATVINRSNSIVEDDAHCSSLDLSKCICSVEDDRCCYFEGESKLYQCGCYDYGFQCGPVLFGINACLSSDNNDSRNRQQGASVTLNLRESRIYEPNFGLHIGANGEFKLEGNAKVKSQKNLVADVSMSVSSETAQMIIVKALQKASTEQIMNWLGDARLRVLVHKHNQHKTSKSYT